MNVSEKIMESEICNLDKIERRILILKNISLSLLYVL